MHLYIGSAGFSNSTSLSDWVFLEGLSVKSVLTMCNALTLDVQVLKPLSERGAHSASEQFSDDDGITDGGEEPPTSDVDAPALSTMSSTASVDIAEAIAPPHRKRKLSDGPPNEGEPFCKFPKTSYQWTQSNGVGRTWPNNTEWAWPTDTNTTSRSNDMEAVRLDDDTDKAPTARPSLHPVRGHPKIGHKVEPGTSRSAIASRKLREKATSGSYVVREKRFETWKEKITNLDPDARFDKKNTQKVLHSRCSAWLLVKEPGDTTRFKQHVEACQAKPVPVRGTLMGMGWLKSKKSVEEGGDGKDGGLKENGKKAQMPCRGVSDMDNPSVDRYLRRTGAEGGGGRSIHIISKERFKTDFKNLSRVQKEEVQATQIAEWMWRNDHSRLRVHATNCERFTSSATLNLSLCGKCKNLLVTKAFADAIRKKMPEVENLKYNNLQYLNPVLVELYGKAKGLRRIIENKVSNLRHVLDQLLTINLQDPRSTPCIRYAEAILNGEIKNEVFNDLLEAMCVDLDKTQRGVGLQNFKYAPAWDELCHLIYIVSPRAHWLLGNYFPVRTSRSFR
jgi:hypothetical protein